MCIYSKFCNIGSWTVFIQYMYCAQHDYVVHQRMNATGLLPFDLFSWNKAKLSSEMLNMVSLNTVTIYIQNGNLFILFNYVLCARWVSFVTPDSSPSLPDCSMRVLPPPLLLINCLSGGPGPPPFPTPGLTPFPSGSRHPPASSSATCMFFSLASSSDWQNSVCYRSSLYIDLDTDP